MVQIQGFKELFEVIGGFLGSRPSSHLACHCHLHVSSSSSAFSPSCIELTVDTLAQPFACADRRWLPPRPHLTHGWSQCRKAPLVFTGSFILVYEDESQITICKAMVTRSCIWSFKILFSIIYYTIYKVKFKIRDEDEQAAENSLRSMQNRKSLEFDIRNYQGRTPEVGNGIMVPP
jgi:hypothetical protein